MDPLSHAALGRTLVALRHESHAGRAAVATAALGALSPDIDAAFMPFGWDLYLRAHEIGTHTLIGTIVCAVLTAGVVRAVARRESFRALLIAAWLGAASHVLLDLLSSARLRVLWPFVDTQLSIPLVAMADPWLAAILIGAAVALWFARGRRRVAVTAVAIAAAFLAVKAVMGLRAYNQYLVAGGNAAPARAIVEAKWASLTQWHVFDRTRDHLRYWRTSAESRPAELVLTLPIETETPQIAASRSLSTVRHFLRVHDLSFAAVIPQPDGREWILWSDIRYCWDSAARAAPQLDPAITVNGTRLSCALWFGGEFDPHGNLVQQLVKVIGLTQTREPVP